MRVNQVLKIPVKIKNCSDKLLEIEDEIRILLIPKDPNDGKDIIFEIS